VLVLATADKLDNIRSLRTDLRRIGDRVWQALTAPKEEQCWYFTSLAAILIRRLANTKGEGLSRELQIEVDHLFGSEANYEETLRSR
jgi:hypothetical protein